jgi:hypothetical protein
MVRYIDLPLSVLVRVAGPVIFSYCDTHARLVNLDSDTELPSKRLNFEVVAKSAGIFHSLQPSFVCFVDFTLRMCFEVCLGTRSDSTPWCAADWCDRDKRFEV